MSEECNTGAVPTEAVKLDKGKPKLSLIHPSVLGYMLTAKTSTQMPIRNAMMSLSAGAHAPTREEFEAHVIAAFSQVITYCGENRIALELMTRAMEYGANKPEYGRNNWKKGMNWSRLIDAALRHGLDILDGDEIDADSGNPHVAHMLASIHMLLGSFALGAGTNDIV